MFSPTPELTFWMALTALIMGIVSLFMTHNTQYLADDMVRRLEALETRTGIRSRIEKKDP
jgi:hypothetical protein